jgi:hypothetical protein
MSASPPQPEDIPAEVPQVPGGVSSDAATASFIEKVERAVAERVDARLASLPLSTPAKRDKRGALLKGMAIGVCAGALAVGLAVGLPGRSGSAVHARTAVPCRSCQVKLPKAPVPLPGPGVKVEKPVKANNSG